MHFAYLSVWPDGDHSDHGDQHERWMVMMAEGGKRKKQS